METTAKSVTSRAQHFKDAAIDRTQQVKVAATEAAKSAAERIQNSTTNERLAAGVVALGVAAGAAVAAYKASKAGPRQAAARATKISKKSDQ